MDAGAWGIFRTFDSVQPDLLPLPSDTGLLRVTTTPAVPSQIVVDGVIRDTWSLKWLKIGVGSHEVCFTEVGGFSTPDCQTVDVLASATTVVDGAFTQRGFLRVDTNPALPATISVDGVPRNDWGMWTDLATGSHEVCYGDVADFDTPACETVNVNAGSTTALVGSFSGNPGAPGPTGDGMLRVTTSPAVPSQITVDGVARDTWSLKWVKLAPGSHEVCFSDVAGFTTPICETVAVADGATTVVQGMLSQRGFLRVDTAPAIASTIVVNLVPRDDWGIWTDVEPGSYQVCFGLADGFSPPCETVAVVAGTTTTVTGSWSP